MSAEEKFHEHLDVCRQCREEVFNLCPIGSELLMAAAKDESIDKVDLSYTTGEEGRSWGKSEAE